MIATGVSLALPSRMRRWLLLAILAAAGFSAGDVSAAVPLPVVISVVGQGAVRLRVASGHVAPCDSSEDHVVLDNWVRAGDVLSLALNDECACIEHTYGSFREAQWSLSAIACRPAPTRFRRVVDPVVRVRVSTDQP
jgi:hypothetical protein